MANKSGGDIFQQNAGGQFNVSGQEEKGVANAGPAAVDSAGGSSFLDQAGLQSVSQALGQLNLGIGGNGGDDNIEANTVISIA